jgi:IclR family pca regulon transcriptional regulator
MAVKQTADRDAARPVRAAEGMGGLAKGLAVIEAFSRVGVLNVADAARAADATRAAARRCLLTLADLGYVERIGREFRPLPRLRNLGRGSDLRARLAEESGPVLAKARDALNESVSLAVLDGDDVLFIARAEAQHIVSTGVRVGAHLPAYCSATGRVLLAARTDADLRVLLGRKPFPARTPHTLTSPAAVFREIRAVEAAGYAISDEELEIGMRSLAVPVRDGQGAIIAALSVSAFAARVSRDDLRTRFRTVLSESLAQMKQLL